MAESARPSGRKRRRPWIQLAVLTVITHSVASAAQLTSSSSSGSWSSADELRIESAIVTSTLPVPSPTAETALRTTPFSTAHVVRPNVPAPVQTTPAPSWTAVPTSSSPASTKTTSIPEKIDDNGAASKASSDSSGATSGSSDAGVPGDGSYGSSLPPDDSSGSTLLPPKPGPPLPRPPGDRPMPSPVPFPPDPPGLLPAPLPPWSPEPTLETLPPKPTSPSLTSAPTTPLPGPGIMPKPVVLRPTKAPTTPPASTRPPPPPPPQGGTPISDDDDIESPPPPSYLPPPLQPPSPTASSPTSSTPSSNPIGGDTASGSDDSDETGPPPPSRSLPPLRASQEPTPTPEGRTSATPESQDPYAQESPRPPMLTQAPKTSSPQPESSRRYERGDDVVKIEVVSSGSGSTLTSPRRIVITPSKAPAIVIGGNDDSVLTNSGASSHRGESSGVYTFLRYVTSIAALLSIFWLAGCQVAATMSRPAHMFIGPNQWEFALFSSYAQTIGSFSQLVITPNIPRFVLRFADAYSWTVFLPLHGSDSGISTSGTTEGRRLDRVVLDGIVGFADRVGIQESDILSKTTIGFVVVMAALLTVLVAFYFIPKCMSVPKSIEDTDSRAPTGTTLAADGLSTGTQENELDKHDANTYLPMLFVGGLVVSVWFFSLYPLTLFSSYEIATEARTSIDGSSITIAILVLACFCITGLLFAVAMIWRLRSDSALSSTRHLALWGSLYAGTRPSCRLFFVVFALNQMLRAVIVGSVVDDAAQLISLIAIDMVVLVTVCLLRPFESSPLLTPLVCVVYGLRILNTSLGFAFSRSSTRYPARRAVGIAFIAINSAVVLLWFARHFGMACHIVRRAIAARRRRHPPPTRSPMEDAAYVSIDQRDEEVERIYRQFANRRDSW